MAKLKGKAVVAQSGGPTSVINASACGVIQTALGNSDVFTGVYGALNGIHDAWKLNQHAITSRLDDAATMRGNSWIDNLVTVGPSTAAHPTDVDYAGDRPLPAAFESAGSTRLPAIRRGSA